MLNPYITSVGPVAVPTWHEMEKLKCVMHEAGQAVIARLVGFHVAWISVDRSFIDNDSLAIKNEVVGAQAVCMTISSDRLVPIFNRRSALNKEGMETLIGYSMHVLAGPNVEYIVDRYGYNNAYAARDQEQLLDILQIARLDRQQKKKILQVATRRMNKLVEENWTLIVKVGSALSVRKTIFADELDELIGLINMKVAA